MYFISELLGYVILIAFGVLMFLVTFYFSKKHKSKTKDSFLVANRKVNWFFGGTSIAASWIWAPALFISVQMAYTKGLAGIFWFTLPNIVALAIFAFLAPKIRKKLPYGYTLPQYIKYKLKSSRVHNVYLFPYFFYQVMAITVQLFAGGSLITLLTGIPLIIVMPILALIALIYTWVSGLEASIITDFFQIGLIILIGVIILPLTWSAAGGFSSIVAGFGGLEGIKNIFDPGVAFSFGVVTAIGLIAGAISDQQYWQRSFSIRRKHLVKSFLFGALLFGLVPIALSTLGFIAANPVLGILLPPGVDVSMIGVQTVANLLPHGLLLLFIIMLLAGISSTLDSGLSATSSLWITDVLKNKFRSINQIRFSMIGVLIIGLAIAILVTYIPGFGLKHLWWIVNTIAACVMIPTVLSLYWNRLSAKGVFWGVLISFIIGVPLFIYSNIINNATWIVFTTLFIVGISTLFCLIFPQSKNNLVPINPNNI